MHLHYTCAWWSLWTPPLNPSNFCHNKRDPQMNLIARFFKCQLHTLLHNYKYYVLLCTYYISNYYNVLGLERLDICFRQGDLTSKRDTADLGRGKRARKLKIRSDDYMYNINDTVYIPGYTNCSVALCITGSRY